jgi:hypothetical protein
MDQANELDQLRIQVDTLERALVGSRRETLESHARLAMISKIVRDVDRCERAPQVTFGAVRAALFNERPPTNLFN